jgi:hypothetical protein
VQAKSVCGCSEKNLSRLCGSGRLGRPDVSLADIGVVVGSWISGEVSEFDAFVVGPSEVGNQFQFNEKTVRIPIPLSCQTTGSLGILEFEVPELGEDQ